MTNATWIDKLCQQLVITEAKLAERLGISPRTLEGYRYGRPVPKSVQTLIEIIESQKCDD